MSHRLSIKDFRHLTTHTTHEWGKTLVGCCWVAFVVSRSRTVSTFRVGKNTTVTVGGRRYGICFTAFKTSFAWYVERRK